MALTLDEKINLSKLRIDKAHINLKDAEDMFKQGKYGLTINRSYYAILSASRSLLILKGIDTASHDGAKTMLSLHFVKEDYLPKNVIDSFRILLARRTDVDYGDFSETSVEEAEDSLNKAREFVSQVENAITCLKSEWTD